MMHYIAVTAFVVAIMAAFVAWLVRDMRRMERENEEWMVRHGFRQKGDE
jgi:hypothetical protein